MPLELSLTLSPRQAADERTIRRIALMRSGLRHGQGLTVRIVRRSIDARKGSVRVNVGVVLLTPSELADQAPEPFRYQPVQGRPEVIVVGAGPAGLFAALRLIELGYRPIVLERGHEVGRRKRDIASLHRNAGLDPSSNYAFGEGGAGTYTDGKLYTRSHKRGDTHRILRILHAHGAQDEILYDAHPHVGSNVLPRVVANLRGTILAHGGEVRFGVWVKSLTISGSRVVGVQLGHGSALLARAVVLATGHSAHDMYAELHGMGLALEPKPFAMGVRVEHPQALIDSIQYRCGARGEFLPAAAYSLVHQVRGRGVYSFCMCPGGVIVPAATQPDAIVVNGMSASGRRSPWANAGIVVEMQLADIPDAGTHGALAGLAYQRGLELQAYQQVGQGLVAPAQRLTDFMEGRGSLSLPRCSYTPGVAASRLDQWLPEHIGGRLREGFLAFDRRMRGFVTPDALVVGVESRTSSPVRIPRHPQTLQHVEVQGLFPSGEGAGYAGGIVSSAIDGERCAQAVAHWLG